MKYLYIVILFLALGFTLVETPPLNKKNLKFFEKEYAALKDDYLFISKTEVSNAAYRAYLDWTFKHQGMEAYQKALPDTTLWKALSVFTASYTEDYFRHSAFGQYPVVGVSWQQAQAYCNWVADRTMETAEFKTLNIEKLIVRLPSEKEWMQAARGTLPGTAIWPWPGNTIRIEEGKDMGKARLNIRTGNNIYTVAPELEEAGFITTPVDSYWPNTLGLYNICGNVSEWVEEKKARGGGWKDFPYSARIDYQAPILDGTTSSVVIGFRPLVEIVAYKTSIKTKPLKLDANMLDKSVVKVKDSLYAAIFETDNLLYNTFLSENPDPQYRVHDKAWSDYTRYHYMQQYSWLPQYDACPVVNISYESAEKFCEWLTLKYNGSAKRRYKKVVFRLPSEPEWEWAAMGGMHGSPYPWGGPFIRNNRGAYLANFSPLEEQYLSRKGARGEQQYAYPGNDSTISRGVDGLVFTGPVKSYFPNAIGLYNCSGNVAEMTTTKGLCKGGSWTSSQHTILVSSKEIYTHTDANLGFRYVMQVIEL
jgi:formylglycine-generating enzyme required for sulfatase activity